MGDLTGQWFGNYRLVKLLGQGGFADVYQGKHLHLETPAAIKILRTQLVVGESKRFLAEARTLENLKHEAIITIKDCGIENSTPFLVMDYAPYGTLRQRYPRSSQVPQQEALTYVQQVASALQYAHDRQIVHRDVKPENMLIGVNQNVLLSDFGIAVVLSSTTSQHSKVAAGTALYMAPEQIMSQPQPASDQYALAVILHEWLCGTPPFQGSFAELTAKHLHAPPPPCRTINAAIPIEIEQAILKALSKDPMQRFTSVQEFAHTLTSTTSTASSFVDNTLDRNSFAIVHPTSTAVSPPPPYQPPSTPTPVLPPVNTPQGKIILPHVTPTPPLPQKQATIPPITSTQQALPLQSPIKTPQSIASSQPDWSPPNSSAAPITLPTPPPEARRTRQRRSPAVAILLILLILILVGGGIGAYIFTQSHWPPTPTPPIDFGATAPTQPSVDATTPAQPPTNITAQPPVDATTPVQPPKSMTGKVWQAQNSGISQYIRNIVWSGSLFVAVGEAGTILTSPDASSWTSQSSGTTQILVDVTWSGSQFVAVGEVGTILTSPDGSSWTPQSSGTTQTFISVTWSGSLFVAVGEAGMILTSPDGSSWASQSSGTTQFLLGITWSGSLFVAVGEAGTILTSPDASSWTSRTYNPAQYLTDVAWLGSQFVAVGASGTILTSSDGSSWTSQSSGASDGLNCVAWSGSLFVAVGMNGIILTSPDGSSWSSQSSGITQRLLSVIWSGSQFVAVGASGTILTSS